MGTNYYLEEDVCCECDKPNKRLHIGKSSGGWCFSLHVIPEEGLTDFDTWFVRWMKEHHRSRIVDEYGGLVTAGEMYAIVKNRSWARQTPDQFDYAANHAEPGPNGLARHQLLPGHCIGHGEGTWDLIQGEFS